MIRARGLGGAFVPVKGQSRLTSTLPPKLLSRYSDKDLYQYPDVHLQFVAAHERQD